MAVFLWLSSVLESPEHTWWSVIHSGRCGWKQQRKTITYLNVYLDGLFVRCEVCFLLLYQGIAIRSRAHSRAQILTKVEVTVPFGLSSTVGCTEASLN